jgi:hypothetical protein
VSDNPSREKIVELEHAILCALCGIGSASNRWDELKAEFSGYAWQKPEHTVVYEALRRIRARDQLTWREQLPAQATRMGFPDVDWAEYFTAEEQPPQTVNLNTLIGELKAAAGHRA